MLIFDNTPFYIGAVGDHCDAMCGCDSMGNPCACLAQPNPDSLIDATDQKDCADKGGNWRSGTNDNGCISGSYCFKQQYMCDVRPQEIDLSNCRQSGGTWRADNCGCECPQGTSSIHGVCERNVCGGLFGCGGQAKLFGIPYATPTNLLIVAGIFVVYKIFLAKK